MSFNSMSLIGIIRKKLFRRLFSRFRFAEIYCMIYSEANNIPVVICFAIRRFLEPIQIA